MIINNIIKSCKNIKINNLNNIIYCKYEFNNQVIKQQQQQQQKRNYSNNISINKKIIDSNNNNNSIHNQNNNNNNNNKDNKSNNNKDLKIKTIFKGIENEIEIENEYKPKLLELLRDQFKFTQIKEVSKKMLDSLMHCPQKQITADQEMLYFFGELLLKETINNPLDFPFPDKALYKEFEETVKSEYYLRKRCEEIGLSQFIRFSYSSKWSEMEQVYANHYYYQCLVKFIGSLYLDYDFKVANQFILKVLLDLPNKQLASILLEKPENIMIKKFSFYKLESPIIKVTPISIDFPFYTTTINSGNTQVSKSFGLSKSESYNSAIEYLNQHSTSLTSLMGHILKNTITYNNSDEKIKNNHIINNYKYKNNKPNWNNKK